MNVKTKNISGPVYLWNESWAIKRPESLRPTRSALRVKSLRPSIEFQKPLLNRTLRAKVVKPS